MIFFLRKNSRSVLPVLILVSVFVFLRLPSLVEPDWYGDEAIYQVVGMGLNKGRLLYAGIWDNKPPFLYLIYAVFNGDLFWIKLASLIAGVFSVILFFLICKKLFKRSLVQISSTTVYAVLFGLPLLEGNIANAENFMLLPILVAFLLFINAYSESFNFKSKLEGKKKIVLFCAGLFLSIAFSFKIVAVFDAAALFIAGFLFHMGDRLFSQKAFTYAKYGFSFLLSFFLIPFLTALYFLSNHAFAEYFSAVFGTNVSYVDVNNYFYFPLGLVGLKLLLLTLTIGVIVYFRKSLGTIPTFIYLWTAFSVFNALFSQRPYTHYLLVLLPSFSLLIGLWLDRKQKVIQSVVIVILILFSVVGFPLYLKTFDYYQNYLAYMTGRKSVDSYEQFFDPSTPLDYEMANIVSTLTAKSGSVLVLSDHAQIYALSHTLPPGKYITLYHILFYQDAIGNTQRALTKEKTRYIIQTQDIGSAQELLNGYMLRYVIDGRKIYERKS